MGIRPSPCPDKALHLLKFGRADVRLHVSLGNVPEINRIKERAQCHSVQGILQGQGVCYLANLCQLSCC